MERVASITSRHWGDKHETRRVLVEAVSRDNDDGTRASLLMANSGVELSLPDLAEAGNLPRIHLWFIFELRLRFQAIGNGHVPGGDLRSP